MTVDAAPAGYAGYPGLVIPREATPRDPSRATYGGHTAATAAMLGWPLLPWQRLVADVAGELDEHGQYIYGTVLLTVQRQAGKTTLDLSDSVRQCYTGPGRRIWYTAQSGQHASGKWRSMVTDYFLNSRLKDTAKPGFSNGKECLTVGRTGSTFRPHPPTVDSLHSQQSDKNTIDEAWSFTAVHGAALLQAITPTTTTRRKATGQRPQLWIMSTEGSAESTWLNDLLDDVRAGNRPDVAFFDFGIPHGTAMPDVDDPADVTRFLDLIWEWHPGAGYLFERADLDGWLDQLGSLSEFARAYGNLRTGATERIMPEADWNGAGTAAPLPDGVPVCFAGAAGIDGMDATITATAYADVDDGAGGRRRVKITEVIEHHAGTAWLPARLKELCDTHDAPAVVDRGGPSADLADACKRAGVPLIDATLNQLSGGSQAVLSGVVHRDRDGSRLPPVWLHRPHQALNDAVDTAAKRSVGDGAWVWGRRASVGSISALEAATWSSWGVDHLPERVGVQLF